MTSLFRSILSAALCFPTVAVAHPCDNLLKQAQANQGIWDVVPELPPSSVAEHGPWWSRSVREGNEDGPLEFQPHHPQDRERLLAEAQTMDEQERALIAAYLSPSPEAFDKAMDALNDAMGAGEQTVSVKSWAGYDVFAVSTQDSSPTCRTVLFYHDEQGRLHPASASDIYVCDRYLDREPELIKAGDRFGFLQLSNANATASFYPDMWQKVQLWQGDRLGPLCHFAYYYDIGYKVSTEHRLRDEQYRDRPATAFDAEIERLFPSLMPAYAELYQATSTLPDMPYSQREETQKTIQTEAFRKFADGDSALESDLTAAQAALDHRGHGLYLPIRLGQTPYLVKFSQQSAKFGVYPYLNLDVFNLEREPKLVSNLTLDLLRERLRKVEIVEAWEH